MAKVTAPLISLDARGKLADTLVFGNWKGIPTVRQYVIPANPRTTAQVAQRDTMAAHVAFFRAQLPRAADRDAWRLYATARALRMSGFNAAVRNMFRAAEEETGGPFATAVDASGEAEVLTVNATILRADTQAAVVGQEIQLWVGSAPTNLALVETETTQAEGAITFTHEPGIGWFYIALKLAGVNISGVWHVEVPD